MVVGDGWRSMEVGDGGRSVQRHPGGLPRDQTWTNTLEAHPCLRVHFPSHKPLLVLVHRSYHA